VIGRESRRVPRSVASIPYAEAVVDDLGEPAAGTRRTAFSSTWNTAAAVVVCTSAPRVERLDESGVWPGARDTQLDLGYGREDPHLRRPMNALAQLAPGRTCAPAVLQVGRLGSRYAGRGRAG